jgi:hypothetical protein
MATGFIAGLIAAAAFILMGITCAISLALYFRCGL